MHPRLSCQVKQSIGNVHSGENDICAAIYVAGRATERKIISAMGETACQALSGTLVEIISLIKTPKEYSIAYSMLAHYGLRRENIL
jgi:hypothetical protein